MHPREGIPLKTLTFDEAFSKVFHARHPEWLDRMQRPDCFAPADWAKHDRDERETCSLLLDCYRDGAISFYVRDESGAVLRLTSSEGRIPQRVVAIAWKYDPFGLSPGGNFRDDEHTFFLVVPEVERLV